MLGTLGQAQRQGWQQSFETEPLPGIMGLDLNVKGAIAMDQQTERLVMMAEDELTEYSTEGRKMQKLRRKIGISVPPAQQKEIKEAVIAAMPKDPIQKLIEKNRQLVALPFWGITGLGLLLGISMFQPLDLIATFFGGIAAFSIQKLGWQLQAKRLLIKTLEEMEDRAKNPDAYE